MDEHSMFNHCAPSRLGRAARRVQKIIADGMSEADAARMLNAWWPDCSPRPGEPWARDEVFLVLCGLDMRDAKHERGTNPIDDACLDACSVRGFFEAHSEFFGGRQNISKGVEKLRPLWRKPAA